MLRTFRKARNLTQAQLGRLIGVGVSQLSAIEQGSRTPSLRVALRLVEQLLLAPTEALTLLRELAALPTLAPAPALEVLPLSLEGQAVELLALNQDAAGAWWATVRPSRSPTATARRVPLAGLALLPLPLPAVRAA